MSKLINCFETVGQEGSKSTYARCSFKVIISAGCYIETAFLAFLIYKEVKKKENSMKKLIILILSALFMLNAAGHYSYYPGDTFSSVSKFSMELFRTFIFFSVFHYFTQQVVILLKN